MDKKDAEQQYDWNINKGDYKLSRESTRTHHKKKERKKLFKTILWSIGYLSIVILAAFWFFSK